MDRRFFLNVLGAVASAPMAVLKYTPAAGGVIEQPVKSIVPVHQPLEPGKILEGGVHVTIQGIRDGSYFFDGFVQSFNWSMPGSGTSLIGHPDGSGPFYTDPGQIDLTIIPTGMVSVGFPE